MSWVDGFFPNTGSHGWTPRQCTACIIPKLYFCHFILPKHVLKVCHWVQSEMKTCPINVALHKKKKQRKKCFQHYLIKDVKIALFVRLMSDPCLFQEVGINFSPLQSSATILQAYELSKSGSQWKWSAITWKWLKKPKLSKPFYKNPTSYHKESN